MPPRIFADEVEALRGLLFNGVLQNEHNIDDFARPRALLGYVQALISVVLRTRPDSEPRSWTQLSSALQGVRRAGASPERGLIDVLFDCVESLLPQKKELAFNGVARSQGRDQVDIPLWLGMERGDEQEVCTLYISGLSCCSSDNQQAPSTIAAVCEALQLQLEILHIIACALRVVWSMPDDAGPKIRGWHQELGLLPTVLRRLYVSDPDSGDMDQQRMLIWSNVIQRIRLCEKLKDDPLVECLADHVQDAVRTVLISALEYGLGPESAPRALRPSSQWCATEDVPASVVLALLGVRFLQEMRPLRPDGSSQLLRPRYLDEIARYPDACAHIVQSFSEDMPLHYHAMMKHQEFLREFELLTDLIVLEIKDPGTAQPHHVHSFATHLRTVVQISGGAGCDLRADCVERCLMYVGCGLESLPELVQASWLLAGGLIGATPTWGEGGTPAVEGGSPEWELLVQQQARSALLNFTGLACLAWQQYSSAPAPSQTDASLGQLLVAADKSVHLLLQGWDGAAGAADAAPVLVLRLEGPGPGGRAAVAVANSSLAGLQWAVDRCYRVRLSTERHGLRDQLHRGQLAHDACLYPALLSLPVVFPAQGLSLDVEALQAGASRWLDAGVDRPLGAVGGGAEVEALLTLLEESAQLVCGEGPGAPPSRRLMGALETLEWGLHHAELLDLTAIERAVAGRLCLAADLPRTAYRLCQLVAKGV